MIKVARSLFGIGAGMRESDRSAALRFDSQEAPHG
jgi:hypothetical protein